MLHFLLLSLLLSWLRVCTGDGWDQSLVLDNDGKFIVHWSLGNDETIKFMVEAEALGYVGFGLSMTGGMVGSDIVTGWIDNGIVSFQDRHGLGNFIPQIDDSQDWELLSGSKNDTHTVLTFWRKLDTCDKEQDIVIDRNKIRLIYAYSEGVPKSPEDLAYHQWRRGIKGTGLLEPPIEDNFAEKEIYYWDVLSSNFTLTSEIKSVYWCTVVKGPEFDIKHHVIKYETLTMPGGKPYLHHVTMYECMDSDVSPEKYETFAEKGSYMCSDGKIYQEFDRLCSSFFAGLAVGIEEYVFPKHIGSALKASPPKYYRVVVHYENPSGSNNVTVQSGLRFWYTPELRKYDLGIMMIGAQVSPLMVIPPAQNSYVTAAHGYSECLDSSLPPEGVNITTIAGHAHVLARRIIVRHFRGNKELRPILRNDHFDFNYQRVSYIPEEIRLLPGDHVVVECTYNSSMRNSPTFGGYTTHDEMCLAYVTYYPETRTHASLSHPSAHLIFGLTGLDGYTPNTTKQELRRRLETVDWSKVNASLMEAATRFSPHQEHCFTDNGRIIYNMVTYPKNYEPYMEKDEFPQRKSKKSKHVVSTGSDNRPFIAAIASSYAVILYAWKN